MQAFLAVIAVLVSGSVAQYVISPYSLGYNPFITQYTAPFVPPVVHPVALPVSSQYHAQDELGQFAFGHSSPGQAREEVKSFDGTVRGSYSYVDPNGKVNQVVYKAGHDGFQVLGANNLPVAPVHTVEPVKDTAEVIAARADFARKFEEAKEAALKAPEEIKSRRRRDAEEKKEKTAELPTLTIPASRTIFNPFVTADFYNPVVVKTVSTPIVSPLVSVLGKTTLKTSELKTVEDSNVPASTKLAEIKETEKEILTPLSYHAPLAYSALPYSTLPLTYSSHPFAYSSYPFAYSPYIFKR